MATITSAGRQPQFVPMKPPSPTPTPAPASSITCWMENAFPRWSGG